ncbi:MAG: sulfite exporter TauE/SafE family protein [Pseudomonadota bacterium]
MTFGTDPAVFAQMLLLLLAVGGVAGVLAGLLGVGGGIVLVPAFFHVFETLGYAGPQLMQMCVATSLATIVITSARSVASHNKKGAVDWVVLRGWAPGIVLGAGTGVVVVSQLDTLALQIIFGALAFCIGLYMAFGRATWRVANELPRGIKRALISPWIGLISVLIGVGGGSMGVPLLTLHGRPMHQAVGTAAGFGLLIAAPSVFGFFFVGMSPEHRPPFTLGVVNGLAFATVVGMTFLTAPVGARLAHKLEPRMLRRVFAGFLLVIAANMIRKAIVG